MPPWYDIVHSMIIGTPLSSSATRVMLLGAGELGKEIIIAFHESPLVCAPAKILIHQAIGKIFRAAPKTVAAASGLVRRTNLLGRLAGGEHERYGEKGEYGSDDTHDLMS